MSYGYRSRGGDPELDAEMARERQREVEAKAERYAELHRDDDGHGTRTAAIRDVLSRAWAKLGRRS